MFIYFKKETKDVIINNFYNALNDEGFLIIGKSEVLFYNNYFQPINLKERIYKKI